MTIYGIYWGPQITLAVERFVNIYLMHSSVGSCPVIVTSENMMLSSTQMSFNTVITVSCNEGFVLYNHTSYCNVTCTEQFIWSTDPSSFHCTGTVVFVFFFSF